MMTSEKSQPVVMVTGAGSGLGLATALRLAREGLHVYGSVRNEPEAAVLRASAAEERLEIQVLEMDVTQEKQVKEVVSRIVDESKRLDALAHFAGMTLRGFFEDLTLAEIREVFEINVFGTMTVVQQVLPHMRRQRSGRILLTTSVAGRIGTMSISGYASSKFAIEGFGECLSQEVAPFGIHVSLLEPGLVKTPNFSTNRNRAKAATDPKSVYYKWFCQHEHIVDTMLEKNRFTPEDVAETALRILSKRRPRLRYIVGLKAKLIVGLRRYIPGEVFEKFYFGLVRRIVTKPRSQTLVLK